MLERVVDGQAVRVPAGSTVLQACEEAGKVVPRFCYQDSLRVAGNCRRCLVERKGSPKPVASCARPAQPGRVIFTESPQVRKAREGVLEFLLRNHPLDCPICDQGGECDLQDQARVYGSDRSRRWQEKRSVTDKELGPVVKAVRTRCIQCTRCVRFAAEIAGVGDLGATGRGTGVEIGTYVRKALRSERSGNLVDLCPVGALTSKPRAGAYRSWLYTKEIVVDRSDALQAGRTAWLQNGLNPERRTPLTDEEVGGQWITDKARYRHEGARVGREEADKAARFGVLQQRQRAASTGEAWDRWGRPKRALGATRGWEVKEALARRAEARYGVEVSWRGRAPTRNGVDPTEWLSEWSERASVDAIRRVGTDVRKEAALVNTAVRQRFLDGAWVGQVGPSGDLTYPTEGRSFEGVEEVSGREWTDVNHGSSEATRLRRLEAGAPKRRLGAGARSRRSHLQRARERRRTYGARSRGWNPLRRIPVRANEVSQWLWEGSAHWSTRETRSERKDWRGEARRDASPRWLIGVGAKEAARRGWDWLRDWVQEGEVGDRLVAGPEVGRVLYTKDWLAVNREGRPRRGWQVSANPAVATGRLEGLASVEASEVALGGRRRGGALVGVSGLVVEGVRSSVSPLVPARETHAGEGHPIVEVGASATRAAAEELERREETTWR